MSLIDVIIVVETCLIVLLTAVAFIVNHYMKKNEKEAGTYKGVNTNVR